MEGELYPYLTPPLMASCELLGAFLGISLYLSRLTADGGLFKSAKGIPTYVETPLDWAFLALIAFLYIFSVKVLSIKPTTVDTYRIALSKAL